MSHFVSFCSPMPFNAATVDIPSVRGPHALGNEVSYSRQTLPTDAIGGFTLNLQNVVIGSRWEIETVSIPGVSVASGVTSGANFAVTLSSYSFGSAYNELRIKVRNASGSPYYQPFETQITAAVGSASTFINQVRDDA